MTRCYRCRCGVLIDKPWMIKAHSCQWKEKKNFIKLFLLTEAVLLAATGITFLFK
ncbi:MAG: hypothetical protein QW416_05945 [Candidatus Nitrosocaldaceae archaeon]